MHDAHCEVLQLVRGELRPPHLPAAAEAVAGALHARYRDAVLGILYYGSCFRSGGDPEGLHDVYVLVDGYRHAYERLGLAAVNAILPPNVFYLEVPLGERIVRAKYAVISLKQFCHRTSPACFNSSIWARFAQPCALLYCRDAHSEARIAAAVAAAVRTFVLRVVPVLDPEFDMLALWRRGFAESYCTELRPERADAVARLVEADRARYERIGAAAAATLPWPVQALEGGGRHRCRASIAPRQRRLARAAWLLRRLQGKALNLLRLIKAAFTFDGGVDYLLWKIERHSGIRVEATPMMRRHPLLACWGTLWRLYRRGAFR